MKKLTKLFSILLVPLMVLLFIQCQEEPLTVNDLARLEKNLDPPGNRDDYAATPNLSFPLITTDVVDILYHFYLVDVDGDGSYEPADGDEYVLGADTDADGVVDAPYDPNLHSIDMLIRIVVAEVITDNYTGDYQSQVVPPDWDGEEVYEPYILDETTGCFVDLVNNDTGEAVPDGKPDKEEPIGMLTWLPDNAPWYPHPSFYLSADPNLRWDVSNVAEGYANSWQAKWEMVETPVVIDFVDWGNPMENTYPLVGYRFPVEVALYTKLTETMIGYKMACLQDPHSATELYATGKKDGDLFTYDSYYATVLTNKFRCEVLTPSGTIERINLGPGIGPTGKMNFASAGGGWVPKVPGTHRIYLYIDDPNIVLSGASINDDDHYVMWTECGPAEGLSKDKLNKSYLIGNVTWIDVLVKVANSNGGRKTK